MSLSNQDIGRTTDYRLFVGILALYPEPYAGKAGYRLENTRTGVIEKEGLNEAQAIREMHNAQKYLDEVLQDPEGKNAQPEAPVDPSLAFLQSLNQ